MNPKQRHKKIVKAFDAYEVAYNLVKEITREGDEWLGEDEAYPINVYLDLTHSQLRKLRIAAEDALEPRP